MVTAAEFNVFDAYSRIRPLDSAEDRVTIEALPDDHRRVLLEMVAAVTAAADREERIRVARSEVRRLEVAHSAAFEADRKANPPATHHSELLRSIAANAGKKLEPIKVNKKARAAREEAEAELALARAELNRATEGLPDLQRASGASIDRWRDCLTTPTADAVARDYTARSQLDRAERLVKTGSAEPAKVVPPHQWPLDVELSARGKTKANRRPQYLGPR
jgi:hypothetical protein